MRNFESMAHISTEKKSGFLDARYISYNTPGLHERPRELERQLIYRINKAKGKADRVLAVYVPFLRKALHAVSLGWSLVFSLYNL
jgi:GTPase Era involved in 16S rRNA processing